MSFFTNVKKFGNSLLVRGYDDNGSQFFESVKYKPSLFTAQRSEEDANCKQRSLIGDKPLSRIRFASMKEADEFYKMYKDVDGYEIHGYNHYDYSYIAESLLATDPKFGLIRVLNFDIEVARDPETGYCTVEEATNPITTIAARVTPTDSVYHVWGTQGCDQSRCNSKFIYHECRSEFHMLESFIQWMNEEERKPDVFTGWNIEFFDIPYLINRMARIGFEHSEILAISPWKKIRESRVKSKYSQNGDLTFDIYGIAILDYLNLFKKFGLTVYGNQESYKLNHIAKVILGKEKVAYEEEFLDDLYDNDYEKFLDYNVRDIELIDDLEKEAAFLQVAFAIAYKAGVNFKDTLGTTKLWDNFIMRELLSKGMIVPVLRPSRAQGFVGGFVKEPKIGFTDWILSFDLNSLYPNIIVQYNISPETLTNETHHALVSGSDLSDNDYQLLHSLDVPDNLTMAPSGYHFKKDKQGILPEIICKLYDERVTEKKKMLECQQKSEDCKSDRDKSVWAQKAATHKVMQHAVKILLNSLYGATGSPYFRYFDVRIAESVTRSGQAINRWAEKTVQELLTKILKNEKDRSLAADTDSIYIDCSEIVEEIKKRNKNANVVDSLDKFAKEVIEPALTKAFAYFAEKTNAFENRMVMKREAIASPAVWTAAKRYMMRVYDNEGVRYAKPKLKITGLEAIKSSTPEVCREKFQELSEVILDKDEKKAQRLIAQFRASYSTLPIKSIAVPAGVQEVDKYSARDTIYKSGTPQGSKAALVYNYYLRQHKLDRFYPLIRGGDKVKLLFLKKGNPINESCIAFVSDLPKEFGLEDYIDHEALFIRGFQGGVLNIFKAINWSIEEINTLEELFV